MTERIWYEGPTEFITNENYFKIVPVQAMTLEEKFNAIVRFFLYLGVIVAILKSNYRYVFYGIIASLFSIVLYEFERKQRVRAEKFLTEKELDIVDNKVCSRSTVENPFMNPTLLDLHDPNKPAACSVENEQVQTAIEKNFEARLFRDVSDLYGKMSSQRQFYTVPLHDQGAFADWLYKRGPSCKEGNGTQCSRNIIEDVQRRPGQSSSS